MINILMYDRGAYREGLGETFVFHPITARGRARMASLSIGTWDEDGALHVSTEDEANAVNEHIGEDFPVHVLM